MADEQSEVPEDIVPAGDVEPTPATDPAYAAADHDEVRDRHINRLLELPLVVASRLGSTRMSVQDILNLGQGSIIELNRVAGSALELVVNGRVVAYGECVIVNDHFGIQLSEITTPEMRLKSI